jgi:hypothetical protein
MGSMKPDDVPAHFLRRFCCKCNREKPMKGGTYPGAKRAGKSFSLMPGGVQPRFICADCRAIKAAQQAHTESTT